jgi:hypothetical protein
MALVVLWPALVYTVSSEVRRGLRPGSQMTRSQTRRPDDSGPRWRELPGHSRMWANSYSLQFEVWLRCEGQSLALWRRLAAICAGCALRTTMRLSSSLGTPTPSALHPALG